jgi:hypothetical protein
MEKNHGSNREWRIEVLLYNHIDKVSRAHLYNREIVEEMTSLVKCASIAPYMIEIEIPELIIL